VRRRAPAARAPQPAAGGPTGTAARVLALQRTVGNTALGRVLQRYRYYVVQEERELEYDEKDSHGTYDPEKKNAEGWGTLKRRAQQPVAGGPVYESDETYVAQYGGAHSQEHLKLTVHAQELIDLLVRRADLAVSAGRPAYMIGLMERVEAAPKAVGALAGIVAATSGETPAAFKSTLSVLAQTVKGLESVEALPPVKETLLPEAPGIKLTGGKVAPKEPAAPATEATPKAPEPSAASSSPAPAPAPAIDPARQTLKACAAKKLILAVPPADPRRMTEVWYDPLGKEPVRVPDSPAGLRYHHRQRVPSCDDCRENLPHLHNAMSARFADVKGALKQAMVQPVPVMPDPRLGQWAAAAMQGKVPAQVTRREPRTKALDEDVAKIEKKLDVLRLEWPARLNPVKASLVDHYWVTQAKRPLPCTGIGDKARQVAFAPIEPAIEAFDALDRLSTHLDSLMRDPYLDAVAKGQQLPDVEAAMAKVVTQFTASMAEAEPLRARLEKDLVPHRQEHGAAQQAKIAADQAKKEAELAEQRARQPVIVGAADPAEFVSGHAAWKALQTPPFSIMVGLAVDVKGAAKVRSDLTKALAGQLKAFTPEQRTDVAAAVEQVVAAMKWQEAKPGNATVRFEKRA
jgi:hypothetical protein